MAHPFESFERIYIINLASRTDRRREMAAQLQRIGLSLDSPRVRLFDAVRPADAGPFHSIGTRGCFMSHLGVLRDAQAAGLERVLVFEDDLDFSADFNARAIHVAALLREVPWALFYGGWKISGAVPEGTGLVEIESSVAVGTSHFIGFQGAAISELAGYLEAMLLREAGDPHGGPMHVDGAYGWFRRATPGRRTVIARPVLGWQRSSRTDVHHLRWIDRTPGVRGLVGLLRRSRNRLATGRTT